MNSFARGMVVGALATLVVTVPFWLLSRTAPPDAEAPPGPAGNLTQETPRPEKRIRVAYHSPWDREFEGPWMSEGTTRWTDNITVEGTVSPTSISMRCFHEYAGFSGSTVELEITRLPGPQVTARGRYSWYKDAGPPFHGETENLGGYVRVLSATWEEGKPVEITFALVDDADHSIQGEVILRP